MAITVTRKTCTRCRVEKDAAEFSVSDKYKSGLYSRCRKCQSEITAEWNRKNLERHKANKSRSDMKLRRERAIDGDRCIVYSADRKTKRCPRCKATKSVDEFSRQYENGKRVPYCRPCKNDLTKEWKERNPNQKLVNDRHNLRKRGITLERFHGMFLKQNGACAICGSKPRSELRLAVDHDHRCCGKEVTRNCGECVRGLLCGPCNMLINRLDFHPNWISKALAYLAKHKKE